MKSDNSPYDEAKAAVAEIEAKKEAHQRTIEARLLEIHTIRSRQTKESLEAQAEAFFATGNAGIAPDVSVIETDIRALHEQTPLFDVEIERRRKIASKLRVEHSKAFFDNNIRTRDLMLKAIMARALTDLATAYDCERELVDEMVMADTSPPAAFRPMGPEFVGGLKDSNSFVRAWLRELAEYYPSVKVEP